MIELYAAVVHKVRKGLVRSTVLGQIHEIKRSINLLSKGRDIKEKEIGEHEDKPKKAKTLRRQVEIIGEGIGHLKEAIKALNRYKNLTTSSLD